MNKILLTVLLLTTLAHADRDFWYDVVINTKQDQGFIAMVPTREKYDSLFGAVPGLCYSIGKGNDVQFPCRQAIPFPTPEGLKK